MNSESEAMVRMCPVFSKDGNEFIVCDRAWTAEEEWKAKQIGMGASLVECVIWGANYTGRTVDATGHLEHLPSTLMQSDVAIISGPMLEEAKRSTNS